MFSCKIVARALSSSSRHPPALPGANHKKNERIIYAAQLEREYPKTEARAELELVTW